MRHRTFTTLTSTAAVAALVFTASAQAPQDKGGKGGGGKGGPPPAIVQIKPNLYEVTGIGGNTTVRVTNEGLLIVDTKNLGQANYDQLMNLIQTVTQQPPKFGVVTHVHQDHSGNIGPLIAAGAQVVAHENLKKALETTYNPPQGKPASPNVTYTRNYTIRLGGTTTEVYNFGPAHTGGDSIVYFPDLRVVAGGDAIPNGTPNCDFPNGGSVINWPKFLDEVLKLDFDTLVPGHGDLMTKQQVQEYKQKWETFISRAVAEVKKGTPKEQLLAAIKVDDLGWNTNSYNQAGRLDAFYAELQKAAQ